MNWLHLPINIYTVKLVQLLNEESVYSGGLGLTSLSPLVLTIIGPLFPAMVNILSPARGINEIERGRKI